MFEVCPGSDLYPNIGGFRSVGSEKVHWHYCGCCGKDIDDENQHFANLGLPLKVTKHLRPAGNPCVACNEKIDQSWDGPDGYHYVMVCPYHGEASKSMERQLQEATR